ncbi:hypothetical protein ONZ45_g4457 [Pleurotus djamor]|nr:hypothetical protein ONZ45_g4457 [Pleurotus djamor]
MIKPSSYILDDSVRKNPPVLDLLRNACPGEVCGALAGAAITPLLAAQPECSQQDLADDIIDASAQFDAATQANMIAIAIEYRQAEKNTPPDFSTNPPTLRNSVFCQKAPRNPQLNGLVQAQDPANDPEAFFDPAVGGTVLRGSQENTAPFSGFVAILTTVTRPPTYHHSIIMAEQTPPKIKIMKGAEPDLSAATYQIYDESHTIGNALRWMLMKNPKVEFCGYSVPHPSENTIQVRIQMYDRLSSLEALIEALNNLDDLCVTIDNKYDQSLKNDSYVRWEEQS